MASILRTPSSEGFPPEFHCPICYDVMVDPVSDTNGNTYERSAIEDWINRNGTSPLTRAVLTLADLRPNRSLRDMIETAHKQKAAELAAQQGESKVDSSSPNFRSPRATTVETKTNSGGSPMRRASATFRTISDHYDSLDKLQKDLRKNGLESSDLIIGIDLTKSNTWQGEKT